MTPRLPLILALVAAVAIFAGLTCLVLEINGDLRQRLADTEKTLAAERLEHEGRIAMLRDALREQGDIHEQFTAQKENLHEALEEDALAALPLSDALRLRIQWPQGESPR